jgi:hypothetical protein
VACTVSAAASAGTRSTASSSARARPTGHYVIHATLTAPRGRAAPGPLRARYLALPYRHPRSRPALAKAAIAAETIPNWSGTVVAGQNGNTYGFTLVGHSVLAGSSITHVPLQVIPVIVTHAGTRHVYDPTAAKPGCGQPVSPVTGVLTGPLLTRHRWYAGTTYVGTDQYTGAQVREEFWAYTNRHGVSPGYHLFLDGSEPAEIRVTFHGGEEFYGGTCDELLEYPLSTWDSYLRGTLFPELARFGVGPAGFPMFVFTNVVFTAGGCCVLGYHAAFNSGGGTQTYGVGDYSTDHEFGATTDLTALSHEAGEWVNDPYGNNPVPPWGHIGQQPDCQTNLEVGDPLGGSFAVEPNKPLGGPTYHLQELAFFGWFFDNDIGVNGWYSTRGTFKSGSALCS